MCSGPSSSPRGGQPRQQADRHLSGGSDARSAEPSGCAPALRRAVPRYAVPDEVVIRRLSAAVAERTDRPTRPPRMDLTAAHATHRGGIMRVTVWKLGGSILVDLLSYRECARRICDRLRSESDSRILVVVSARYGETDELWRWPHRSPVTRRARRSTSSGRR